MRVDDKRFNILYVDDEQNNLTAFLAAFRREYNIFTALSAREGFDILHKQPIQLILTDQRMPEMTGVQFLEAVVQDYPDIVRMILTGYSDIEAVIQAINNGRVYHYITKPWEEENLKKLINTGLDVYNLEMQNKLLLKQLNEEILRQQKAIKIFRKYVPEEILIQMLKSTGSEDLMNLVENRVIAIMFVDIRSFTKISSRLDPKTIVSLLADFFKTISQCVDKRKGSLNKFLGDGALIIFGAPISSIDNPLNAVNCALDIMEAVKELSEKWMKKIQEPIEIGIGINTGEVVVGIIGTEERIEYSVVGDPVNIASRIQEISREIPNSIIISENTYQATKDKVICEDLGMKPIRGVDHKIQIYRLIGRKPYE